MHEWRGAHCRHAMSKAQTWILPRTICNIGGVHCSSTCVSGSMKHKFAFFVSWSSIPTAVLLEFLPLPAHLKPIVHDHCGHRRRPACPALPQPTGAAAPDGRPKRSGSGVTGSGSGVTGSGSEVTGSGSGVTGSGSGVPCSSGGGAAGACACVRPSVAVQGRESCFVAIGAHTEGDRLAGQLALQLTDLVSSPIALR